MKGNHGGKWLGSDNIDMVMRASGPLAKPMTLKEELAVARRAQQGDEAARERLILANLRFAIGEARRYVGPNSPIEDCFQVAVIGLCEAQKRFDPSRGFKFISYATWWIHQQLKVYMAETVNIARLPVNVLPAREQIVADIHNDGVTGGVSDESASGIRQTLSAIPLDYPADNGDTLHDWAGVDDPAFGDVDESLSEGVALDKMRAAVTDREWEVVSMYYGLGMEEPMTLDQIGSILPNDQTGRLGVSRERVRQIKNEALWKMGRRVDPRGVKPVADRRVLWNKKMYDWVAAREKHEEGAK